MLLSLGQVSVWGQIASLSGTVADKVNNEPLAFANIVIQGTQTIATTDDNGFYEFHDLAPGLYNLEVSYVGYESRIEYEIQTYRNKTIHHDIRLSPSSKQLGEVTISTNRSSEDVSVSSIHNVGFNEIIRTPGGNRDVSKTLQLMPGVASIDGFRNDIIIRGGASFENSFYIDGIKVPSINHFTTQGTGGGVWGLINADAIAGVDLYTGAYPVNRGDALSGVFDIRLKKGSSDKFNGNIVLGSSDLSVSMNGPIGNKTNYLVSARQAYLQGVFRLLDFAFLPTYRDFLIKLDHQFDQKNTLTFMVLASDDDVEINTDAKVDDSDTGEQNRAFLSFAPEFAQRSYSVGAVYKRFYDKGFTSLTVNRSFLDNGQIKYLNNEKDRPENLTLDYNSEEAENIIRLENTYIDGSWKFNVGAEYNRSEFKTQAFRLLAASNGETYSSDYDTNLDLNQYAFFANVVKKMADDRLKINLGVRADMSDYNEEMEDIAQQISPQLLISYQLDDHFSIKANAGRYHQLPPFTLMAFRTNEGNLINEDRLKYIESDQAVFGIDYKNEKGFSIQVEGFYKKYNDYPFLLTDSISFTNLGVVSFGAIGDEPATSISEGRAYGFEVSARQKLRNGFFGLATYTYSRSEFKDRFQEYKSTSWDYKHIVNIAVGKKLKNNWEIGLKFRLAGGTPWTPFDLEKSSLIEVFDAEGTGLADYTRLNENRTDMVHQMDIRIDKRFYFEKLSLNIYFDIQNVYNNQTGFPPLLIAEQDEMGNRLIDPNDPSKYQLKFTDNAQAPFFPALGAILEF